MTEPDSNWLMSIVFNYHTGDILSDTILKVVFVCVQTFIVYVRKTATATDLLVALLLRDLRRTRACLIIAVSVKSIVRVLCCRYILLL